MCHSLTTVSLALGLLCTCICTNGQQRYASVQWNQASRNYVITESDSDTDSPLTSGSGSVAWGSFENAINTTGWAHLEIYTNSSYDDIKQAYGAGALEGFLTKDLLSMHWQNTYNGYCKTPFSKYCQNLQDYLNKNLAWVSHMVATEADKDPYWHQVEMFLEQLSGLIDGFGDTLRFPSKYNVDVTGLAMLQFSGDLEDLGQVLQKNDKDHVFGSGSCSGLIKLLPGNKDLFVSQDTWNGYNSMLRILKKYDFQYHMTADADDAPIPGQVMTFSSYPGVLMSGDDFYIMNSGLVSQETTIGNGNPDLWKYVTPENSVLEGIRNIAANRLATSAEEWANIFSKYNSGTYNNQWMVVDYKKFKPGHPLPAEGLLFVLEQIPGMIVMNDLTGLLASQTYFPSYNIPYYPEIFNASGCWNNVKKYGDWFTYDKSPRAQIFREDNNHVTDMEGMIKLMRYNDYTHDPRSRCNCTPPYSAENGISARNDLNPANGTYPFSALGHRSHGGTDMKVTSSSLASDLEFIAVSSPTYDQQPAFQWSKFDLESSVPHIGHPDLWNFKPVQHKWGKRN